MNFKGIFNKIVKTGLNFFGGIKLIISILKSITNKKIKPPTNQA